MDPLADSIVVPALEDGKIYCEECYRKDSENLSLRLQLRELEKHLAYYQKLSYDLDVAYRQAVSFCQIYHQKSCGYMVNGK